MTVVVGYVPTPEGVSALHAAIEQARWRNEDLYVVNASKGDAISDPKFAPSGELKLVQQTLEDSGLPYQLDQHIGGKGGAGYVLEVADKVTASLIVIGIRRRTATGKLITGSDAQQILLGADCPVLAVKPVPGQV